MENGSQNYLKYKGNVKGEVPARPDIVQQAFKDVLWRREMRAAGTKGMVQWVFNGAPPSSELAAILERLRIPYVQQIK